MDLLTCIADVRTLGTHRHDKSPRYCSGTRELTGARLVVGVDYTVYSSYHLMPITERVIGVEPPTDTFVADYARVKATLEDTTHSPWEVQPRAIPVRLHLALSSRDEIELALILCQIVHNVLVQRAFATSCGDDNRARATASTRFEIVDVCFNERAVPIANAESLECIARLVELGVAVSNLPRITGEGMRVDTKMTVLKSLQVLLPFQPRADVHWSVEYADVAETIAHLGPAFFSAIAQNSTLQRLEVNFYLDPVEWDEVQQFANVERLWKWLAYALFSRHACHDLQQLILHVDFLDEAALRAIAQVVRASNPLVEVLGDSVEEDRWISTSRFHIEDPTKPVPDEAGMVFRSPTPLVVRVLEQVEFQGAAWWRVLIPGCGEAWVAGVDATQASQNDDETSSVGRELHIQFEGLVPNKVETVGSFLELVGRDITSIEVEDVQSLPFDDPFDMNEWLVTVLRACPKLNWLTLPWRAETNQLCRIAEAAETGHTELRYFSSNHTFSPDSSDIFHFLQVLSDVTHPLTKKLEELSISISLNDEDTTDTFNRIWNRLLQHNRTLYTVTLRMDESQSVDVRDNQVAIRTAPLELASKIAFLSVVREATTSGQAWSRLDTGVISQVFAFAAAHRIRTITLEYD